MSSVRQTLPAGPKAAKARAGKIRKVKSGTLRKKAEKHAAKKKKK
jgi:hypothetical protein